MCVIAYCQVIRHTYLPRKGATAAYRCASGNATPGCHCRMITDVHVVGDVNQVIQLDPVADNRIAQCSPVDRGIGTYRDIISQLYPAELRNKNPRCTIPGMTESVCAEHCTAMYQAAVTYTCIMVNRRISEDDTVCTDLNTTTNEAACPNLATFAEDDIILDDGVRPDTGCLMYLCSFGNGCRSINARVRPQAGMQLLRDTRVAGVGIIRNKLVAREQCCILLRQDDGTGLAGLQGRLVSGSWSKN